MLRTEHDTHTQNFLHIEDKYIVFPDHEHGQNIFQNKLQDQTTKYIAEYIAGSHNSV